MSEQRLKLTATQRRAFFAGNWPVLAGEGVPPVKACYVHALSSRLSFEVVRVHLRRGRWRLEYQVLDDRETRFYLMPAAASFQQNERGDLEDMPPEEEIGFTRNPKKRRVDPLPTVPPNVQNVLVMRAKLERAQRSSSRTERNSQARAVRERLHSALEGLTPIAQAALLGRIERDIAEALQEEKAA